jgi:hypothetical protein
MSADTNYLFKAKDLGTSKRVHKRKRKFTAWKDILTKAIKSRDIYEYDLKNCFEELQVNKTVDLIREIGLDTELGIELESLNESAAVFKTTENREDRREPGEGEDGARGTHKQLTKPDNRSLRSA